MSYGRGKNNNDNVSFNNVVYELSTIKKNVLYVVQFKSIVYSLL